MLGASSSLAAARRATASTSRHFSTSTQLLSKPQGFFVRPSGPHVPAAVPRPTLRTPAAVAQPHTPPGVVSEQSPNYPEAWSADQNPRTNAMKGPRFEQMDMSLQPQPLSAMEMIAREPIRLVHGRVAACDGGRGPLGHPKVFINLDKPGPKACPYCGIRYEQDHAGHH